ncbi:MAG: acyl-CoA dehydrogenase family protein [Candidatus Eisenbacteria bacterium]|nr:acyl-CoA dehydrogenase family protein [Candidatus Eisenbacteria bacterium]
MLSMFYTKDENAFRDEVRAFAEKEVGPFADEIERTAEYPREVLRRVGQAGYMGAMIPKEYGGTGKGMVAETIIAEEISAVSPVVDVSRGVTSVYFAPPVHKFGSDALRQKYLRPIVTGEKIGAIGITEPDVGSDTAGMKTQAVKDGGDFVITGEKRFITNGSQADFILVFAITDPSVKARDGMTAFVVETSWPGFSVVKDYDLMGMRGARVSHLKFEGVRVPARHVVGKVNKGFAVLMDELDTERTSLAAGAVGYSRAAFEIAVEHSVKRQQFGKEIRAFEGISFKIADMATKLDAARLLTLEAARRIDAGLPATRQGATAKLFATLAAQEIAYEALQVTGGDGYTKQNRTEQLARDARLMTIGGGTAEIMRFIIQREVYRERGH